MRSRKWSIYLLRDIFHGWKPLLNVWCLSSLNMWTIPKMRCQDMEYLLAQWHFSCLKNHWLVMLNNITRLKVIFFLALNCWISHREQSRGREPNHTRSNPTFSRVWSPFWICVGMGIKTKPKLKVKVRFGWLHEKPRHPHLTPQVLVVRPRYHIYIMHMRFVF